MKRRLFLRTLTAAGAGALLRPLPALAAEGVHLVILHTNDTHSRIEPFPEDGGRNAGLGGVARRATYVKQIRRRYPHVLLLDSGDIFQGTPYFNFFGGEVEFKAMSAMRYDAATLGNHDFDNGVEGLLKMLPHAHFPFVSANYEVSGSLLDGQILPYVIKQFGSVRVGIFGLGIAFERLVLPELHRGVRYTDPVAAAQRSVAALRASGCQFVIGLSHLGYSSRGDRVTDSTLAPQVPGLDLLLGGHSHTFMNEPDVVAHADGSVTVIHQVGHSGIRVGRIDVLLGEDGTVQDWLSDHATMDRRWDVA